MNQPTAKEQAEMDEKYVAALSSAYDRMAIDENEYRDRVSVVMPHLFGQLKELSQAELDDRNPEPPPMPGNNEPPNDDDTE